MQKRQSSAALSMLWVVFCLVLPASSSNAQMALPGSFSVSEGGSASYQVPIDVPPGTAGIQPDLTLQYGSGSLDSFVGVGWSLTGLPQIARCAQSVARHGVARGIKFDMDDRFCMDGAPLVAVSGLYGADQTEYRTENESFSRIVSSGVAGSGPMQFFVWTKAGLKLELGATADSRIEISGGSTVRIWAVNKVSDTVGNYMSVLYTEDNANGTFAPARVDYTGNNAAALAPYASVTFTYKGRAFPRSDSRWLHGAVSNHTQLIDRVSVHQGTTLVREYRLSHTQGLGTARDQLVGIELCVDAGGTSCLPKTTLTYSSGNLNTFTDVNNLAGLDGSFVNYAPTIADFNADGCADILWTAADQFGRVGTHSGLWTSTCDGGFTYNPAHNIHNYNNYQYWRFEVGDLNGDGAADLFLYGDHQNTNHSDGRQNILYSNSDGTFTLDPDPQGAGAFFVNWNPILMDITGDGRDDVMWDLQYADGRSQGYRWMWLNTGPGNSWTSIPNVAGNDGQYVNYRLLAGSFSADGFADIIWNSDDGLGRSTGTRNMWLGNGGNNFAGVVNLANNNGQYTGFSPVFGDFNGDGHSDLIWNSTDTSGRSTGTRAIWLSRGQGEWAGSANVAGTNGLYVGWRMLVGDFNADGASDVLWNEDDGFGRSVGSRHMWVSRGNMSFSGITNVASHNGNYAGWAPLLGDFNGDGKSDVFWFAADTVGRSTGSRALWLSNPTPEDLLISVSNGLGSTSHIEYASLSEKDAPYTKDSGAVYPEMDLQAPMYVVSELRADDGSGGVTTTRYRYGGLKYDHERRQTLGFRWREVEQVEAEVVKRTEYRQDFPFTGMTALSQTRVLALDALGNPQGQAGTNLVRQSSSTYECEDFVGANGCVVAVGSRYFAHQKTSTEKGWDLDGTALPETQTTSTYDDYGNALTVDVKVTDPVTAEVFEKNTVNTYAAPNVPDWILGRLTRAEVTSISP